MLNDEVERLASDGHSRQSLEEALKSLFLSVRAIGDDEESDEKISGVWDRLTGWRHKSRRVETRSDMISATEISSQIVGRPDAAID